MGWFLAAFGLYVFSAWPTVGVGDAGELITASVSLGVAHPPGYPLYTAVGKMVSVIIPLGNLAFRVNLASALATAAAVALVHRWLLRSVSGWAAAVAAGVAACSTTVWSQAIGSEVYALHLTCAAGGLWAWERAWREVSPRFLWLLFGFTGLGLANHHTTLLLALPLAAGFMIFRRRSWQDWTFGVLIGLLGVGLYLGLLLRSLANPLVDWGNPESFGRLAMVMLRKQYGTVAPAPRSLGLMWEQLGAYGHWLLSQWSPAWWIPMGVGLFLMFRFHPRRTIVWGATVLLTGLAVFWILNMWVSEHALSLLEEFVTPSAMLWVLPLAIGLEWAGHHGKWQSVLATGAFLGVVGQAAGRWSVLSRAQAFLPAEYALSMLEGAPPRAHVFCAGDSTTFMLMYWHQVEGRRPDMTLYDDTGTVLTDLYGPEFYVTPEPYHTQIMESRQRELIRTTNDPVCFILGAYLHNVSDVRFFPHGLVYEIERHQSPAVSRPFSWTWKRYGWHPWTVPLEESGYLERDILAQIPLARAESLFAEGRVEEARAWYREASYVGAGIDAVQTSLAAILVKKEMYDLGVEVAEQAAARFPHDPDAHNSVGAAYLSGGAPERAVQSFEEALRLQPGLKIARHNLILAYLQMKKWAEAERAAKEAIARDPSDPVFYRHLTSALQAQGRLEEVFITLEPAAERFPSVEDLALQAGNLHLKCNHPAPAAEWFQKVLRHHPHSFVAANNLGVALTRLGKLHEALEAYLAAVRLNPTYVEACANVAGAYHNLGRREEAKQWWRRTLALDPHHSQARQFLER